MFGILPPYMSLLCYANFAPLNILSSVPSEVKDDVLAAIVLLDL